MNIKHFILGIAIFILTIAVGIYGIRAIYGSGPQYEDFCPERLTNNPEQCANEGGTWLEYDEEIQQRKPAVPVNGYCDLNEQFKDCDKELRQNRQDYNRNVFFIALILGIAIIVTGALLFNLLSVGTGIMAGGVGIILFGVMGFWEFANDILKFVMTLLALIIIIALAYYLNKKLTKDLKKKKK
ncbi:hypothetical protein GOV12_02810 [Candidatus Pacearchaeota archaeon]|nr:hypothetical protein [Candidatus Pacearchaeota archaeon]